MEGIVVCEIIPSSKIEHIYIIREGVNFKIVYFWTGDLWDMHALALIVWKWLHDDDDDYDLMSKTNKDCVALFSFL